MTRKRKRINPMRRLGWKIGDNEVKMAKLQRATLVVTRNVAVSEMDRITGGCFVAGCWVPG